MLLQQAVVSVEGHPGLGGRKPQALELDGASRSRNKRLRHGFEGRGVKALGLACHQQRPLQRTAAPHTRNAKLGDHECRGNPVVTVLCHAIERFERSVAPAGYQ